LLRLCARERLRALPLDDHVDGLGGSVGAHLAPPRRSTGLSGQGVARLGAAAAAGGDGAEVDGAVRFRRAVKAPLRLGVNAVGEAEAGDGPSARALFVDHVNRAHRLRRAARTPARAGVAATGQPEAGTAATALAAPINYVHRAARLPGASSAPDGVLLRAANRKPVIRITTTTHKKAWRR
jgi:hypothetical protein